MKESALSRVGFLNLAASIPGRSSFPCVLITKVAAELCESLCYMLGLITSWLFDGAPLESHFRLIGGPQLQGSPAPPFRETCSVELAGKILKYSV